MEIKNMTPIGVTEGFFKLVQDGMHVKLACHVCFEFDSENPSFLRAKFLDETQTRLDITCPVCGFKEENMNAEDALISFIVAPDG